jgi:hypothetical protein
MGRPGPEQLGFLQEFETGSLHPIDNSNARLRLPWANLADFATPMNHTITIQQLHDRTKQHVRRALNSRTPIAVTDCGSVVALLVNPRAVLRKRPRRILLPDYAALLKVMPMTDVLNDLNVVRGDR